MAKKILAFALVLIMALSLCLVGCQDTSKNNDNDNNTNNTDTNKDNNNDKDEEQSKLKAIKAEDMKIGIIYVGPIGDLGYSYAHYQGLIKAIGELGIKEEQVVKQENVPESAECEQVIADLVDAGCNVIYATSFGHGEFLEKVAKEHPEVYFAHATGFLQTENVSNYMGRVYEARYLAGIVAGMTTKSNKIGYVAAKPIAEVIRGINAFTLGVRSVNAEATVDVKWTDTWFDEALEKATATELINSGCDVIAQHCDSTAPQVAAQEAGVKAIGYNSPTADKTEGTYLTAPLFNWDVFYKRDLQNIIDGNRKGETYWEGLKAGMVALDEMTDLVTDEIKTKVEEVKTEIINGKHVFAGEIKDQNGEVKVEEGKTMTDTELLNFDWFVEGVNGTIPKS